MRKIYTVICFSFFSVVLYGQNTAKPTLSTSSVKTTEENNKSEIKKQENVDVPELKPFGKKNEESSTSQKNSTAEPQLMNAKRKEE